MAFQKLTFQRISFQDVMCGYFSLDEISEKSTRSFTAALREFSSPEAGRQVRRHQESHFEIYTSSFQEDVFKNPEFFAVFVGFASGLSNAIEKKRNLASHFARIQNWETADFNQFIDSRFTGVLVDRKNKKIRLSTDFFGKRKLFYKIVDRVCYFSNEFETLLNVHSEKEQVDRQALRSYLACGTTIGPSTISSEIKSVPLQSFVEFSEDGIQVHAFTKSIDHAPAEIDPVEVFINFKKVVHFLTTDLDFKFADLTGGADTRLTLQALMELASPVTYTCENMDLQEGSRLAYDFQIMNIFKEKFNLPVEFDFDEYRSNKKFRRNAFETHREYDGDIYHQCLSGMFGGEFFGGWAYDHFFSASQIEHFRNLDDETLKRFPKDYFAGTLSFEEQIAQQCSQLSAADPKALMAITMFYSSPLYFRKNESPWLNPYLLTARKISAFLGDAVIRSLDVPNLGEKLSGYQFYFQIYESCAPQMMKIPFNTYFATLFPDQLTDIRSVTPPPPILEDPQGHAAEVDLIALKMEALNEFLASTPLNPLQMPQVEFSPKYSG